MCTWLFIFKGINYGCQCIGKNRGAQDCALVAAWHEQLERAAAEPRHNRVSDRHNPLTTNLNRFYIVDINRIMKYDKILQILWWRLYLYRIVLVKDGVSPDN